MLYVLTHLIFQQSLKVTIAISPFLRWETGATQRIFNLHKFTQLVSGRIKILTKEFWLYSLQNTAL